MSPDPYFDVWRRAMDVEHVGPWARARRWMTPDEGVALLAEVDDGADSLDRDRQALERMAYDAFGREHMVGETVALRLRSRCAWRYAHAVTDPGTSAWLARLGPLVEVGAGTGWWAHRIHEAGGDIIATDLTPTGLPDCVNGYHVDAPRWFDVQPADSVDAAAKHPDRTLLVCWPPYKDPMAADAVRAYQGDRVVLVGEDSGGCTGDPMLFTLLGHEHYCYDDPCTHEPEPARFRQVQERAIPQWMGMHDTLTVYERIR